MGKFTWWWNNVWKTPSLSHKAMMGWIQNYLFCFDFFFLEVPLCRNQMVKTFNLFIFWNLKQKSYLCNSSMHHHNFYLIRELATRITCKSHRIFRNHEWATWIVICELLCERDVMLDNAPQCRSQLPAQITRHEVEGSRKEKRETEFGDYISDFAHCFCL